MLTPWITIIGKGVMGMPFVTVDLRRVGGEIKGAKVKVGCYELAGGLYM